MWREGTLGDPSLLARGKEARKKQAVLPILGIPRLGSDHAIGRKMAILWPSFYMCNSFSSCTTNVPNERVKRSYLVTGVSLAAWWSNSPQLALER